MNLFWNYELILINHGIMNFFIGIMNFSMEIIYYYYASLRKNNQIFISSVLQQQRITTAACMARLICQTNIQIITFLRFQLTS